MKPDGKGSEEVFKKSVLDTVKLDELVLTDPKNFREYAVRYTEDELLDALNQCKDSPEKRGAIIEILKIQRELASVFEKEYGDDLDLRVLLDKFYADPDPYPIKHILMEYDAGNPELSFKCGLLKCFTLLLDGKDLSDDEKEFLDEFKIDISNLALINKLKIELELDLKAFYSVKTNQFIDISGDDLMEESMEGFLGASNEMYSKRVGNGRLDGKKFIPGHCAYNDSPDGLKLYGEDVVEYELGDEYIPCSNHASKLSLINRINSSTVEQLQKMYESDAKNGNDLEFWKNFYEDDYEGYVSFLKENLLIEFIDMLSMYDSGDRFMVVKGTYQGTELSDGEVYNCWYVDVRSQNTGEIYRVLSE